MKLFLLYGDTYGCSTNVDLRFAVSGGTVIAKDCFYPAEAPGHHEKVKCLIKPDNSAALVFEGCVRAMDDKATKITVHSKLSRDGAPEIIRKLQEYVCRG